LPGPLALLFTKKVVRRRAKSHLAVAESELATTDVSRKLKKVKDDLGLKLTGKLFVFKVSDHGYVLFFGT